MFGGPKNSTSKRDSRAGIMKSLGLGQNLSEKARKDILLGDGSESESSSSSFNEGHGNRGFLKKSPNRSQTT